jgi:hypothetical protein
MYQRKRRRNVQKPRRSTITQFKLAKLKYDVNLMNGTSPYISSFNALDNDRSRKAMEQEIEAISKKLNLVINEITPRS